MKFQTASYFLMIRPAAFSYNLQTASTNVFQDAPIGTTKEITSKAIEEFDHMLHRMQRLGLSVYVFEQEDNETPDAVFPNNWISFHPDRKIMLYPISTENRRKERRLDIIEDLKKHFAINEIIDITPFEREGKYLEGTGSLVFDHHNQLVYACLSERTNRDLVNKIGDHLNYKTFTFTATDRDLPIYHTNVMLHIGEHYAVLCAESIPDLKERKDLERILAFTGHELVMINRVQMHAFAGNMLQVQNQQGKRFTLLSTSAIRSLHFSQIDVITRQSELISFDIPTIEKIGEEAPDA